MIPYLLDKASDFGPVLRLIQSEFAYMEGRIDPPSSMHDLTEQALATAPEVWALGVPPVACMVLTPKDNFLYLGKLAVAASHRGQGLARRLVTQAEARATALGLAGVELQTRIELIENQQAFRAMGFVETARTAHQGHANPTSITYRKERP